MNVTVTLEDVDTVQDHGSVVSIVGTTEDGKRVRFAGDHRPMEHMIEALVMDVEITVDVEGWQILGQEAPR